MLRAAAKNYQDVAVVTDPSDYEKILAELKADGQVSLDTLINALIVLSFVSTAYSII